ncbi:conserved protein of unknown function [Candidatus Filomicrobium marinum]|uniref:HigA2-like helix-turn-helix domain-containing protein n=1 Tax=Candidatus Filomicrobium marinum TaxID=1608628 RepID=A0A0D6JFD8_9HYPH|nr:XRE family transcriptional regulator [Candidatus Filomicrobium marinum]CFX24442.1 conserved protein of unknown function [Candidatus Filomicrobium marinum]CPR19168.1 conserved protein of unknown function [Candidatus Filomicrobium marinum]
MSRIKVTKGTGNVYADIGLPDASEHAAKADLVICIARIIGEQNITPAEAARRVGLSPCDMARILDGRFRSHSLEKLTFMLAKLGSERTV